MRAVRLIHDATPRGDQPGGTLLPGTDGPFDVIVGGVVEVSVPLTPAAIITTTVADRATGEPVAGVCLVHMTPVQATYPGGPSGCSDETGAVRIGSLEAGTYNLFAQRQRGHHLTRPSTQDATTVHTG